MNIGKLDNKNYFPEIFQAVAGENYTVYAYMNDGAIRLVNVLPFIEKGGVFEPLKDKNVFKSALTIIGNNVAWDLDGTRDEYKCIDIDPFYIFESPIVQDNPEL
ncbi:MAG: DUF2442 domain-containing protein [Lachnospiraceae bacterium]